MKTLSRLRQWIAAAFRFVKNFRIEDDLTWPCVLLAAGLVMVGCGETPQQPMACSGCGNGAIVCDGPASDLNAQETFIAGGTLGFTLQLNHDGTYSADYGANGVQGGTWSLSDIPALELHNSSGVTALLAIYSNTCPY